MRKFDIVFKFGDVWLASNYGENVTYWSDKPIPINPEVQS